MFTERKRLVIYLDAAELAALDRRAGREPLSSYCRRVLCGDAGDQAMRDIGKGIAERVKATDALVQKNIENLAAAPPRPAKRGKHFTDTW